MADDLKRAISVLLLAAVPLGGCAASIAANAVAMAAKASRGKPTSNAQFAPAAVQACTAEASKSGTVNIIDVEQRKIDRIIVWGTAGEGVERRSFECAYGTKIVSFKLRAINRRPGS